MIRLLSLPPAQRVDLLSTVSWFLRDLSNRASHFFVGKSILIPAGLVLLLALSILSTYVWLGQGAHDSSLVKNVPGPSVTSQEFPSREGTEGKPEGTPAETSPIKQTPAIKSPRLTKERSPELIAQAFIKIDLDEQSAIRSSESVRDVNAVGSDNKRIIRLSPVKTRFLFSLPEKSIAGVYNVSIIDAFGKPLVTGRSRSSDGKTLIMILNFKGLSENKYRLCISHQVEVPDCYQVLMLNNKSAPQMKEP